MELPRASHRLIVIIIGLRVMLGTSSPQPPDPGCDLLMKKFQFEYKYYQEGDVMIGGLFTVNTGIRSYVYQGVPILEYLLCSYIDPMEYRKLLTFIFTVDEINEDPKLLPNLTLGYHLYDSCGGAMKAVQDILQILSGKEGAVPNYSCQDWGKVVGFVGDRHSLTTLPMADILGVYGYTQISYGASDPRLSDRIHYPYFFRTVQDDLTHFESLLKLLRYFDWNWVGIITSRDESGERELRDLSHVITSHGICIEFIVKMSDTVITREKDDLDNVRKATSQVLITCGTCSAHCLFLFQNSVSVLQNMTIILKASWTYVLHFNLEAVKPFNGSLSFAPPVNWIPGVSAFVHSVHPSNRPNDPLLEDIWLIDIKCLSPNRKKNRLFQLLYNFTVRECSGEEWILDTNDTLLSPVYDVVHALAHALHNMHTMLHKTHPEMNPLKYDYTNRLHHYVSRVRYPDISGRDVFFNGRGEVPGKYYLLNVKLTDHKESYTIIKRGVGALDTSFPEDEKLTVHQEIIAWKNDRMPSARCNDYCPAGSRKAPSGRGQTCCYDCVPCSAREISSITDSENCHTCLDHEWPDISQTKCIPKTYTFLSYQEDIMGPAFCFFSISFSVITIQILGIFILFQDTPIVRANNRILSFVLLVSITLSFLCVFLFLGLPVDITCMLRQTAFGIIFSIAVSSVLAKTIMVCIAFKATKPGSSWRKWVGVKVSNSVVLLCSSIQVLINVVWLSTSPPFQEFDMHSYPGKIIVQCNEGSVIAFYSALGYMGILATVSCVLAFMVRTLPDSFNEAKYITFSMLLFCSVWIAMIPAYLSTKGKDMVSVEIFAILASSAGLLGCIFFPKCYIILIKPELNTKKNLLEKRKY